MPKIYKLNLEKIPDSDDLMVTLPDDLLQQVGWKIGDIVKWIDNNDGSWSIVKDSNSDK